MTMQQIAESYGMRGLSIPAKGEVWKHHSGRLYRIDGLRNTAHVSDKFPVMVNYTQVDSGNEWSRRLDDWHRSFGDNAVPVEPLEPLFYVDDVTYDNQGDPEFYPIMKRSVTTVSTAKGKAISLGGPVVYATNTVTAKLVAEVLNAAFPPNPNEPKD